MIWTNTELELWDKRNNIMGGCPICGRFVFLLYCPNPQSYLGHEVQCFCGAELVVVGVLDSLIVLDEIGL